MPIAIDRTSAREFAPQLDDALEIVCNEFENLDPHRQYHNAFARVLKPDPLRRVLMMGTDQRDLFVPLLRRAVGNYVPPAGHIFDLGAGDGQTFGYVADAVPAGTTVALRPGGYHGMLMGLAAPLREGTSFEVALTFARAGTLTVPVEVLSVRAQEAACAGAP